VEITNLSSQRLGKCSVPDEMFLLFDVTGNAHVECNSQVLLLDICLFITMYVPYILYSLFFSPTNALHMYYRGADKFLARTGFKSTRVGFSVDFCEYWY
jgi:hypothetical protein